MFADGQEAAVKVSPETNSAAHPIVVRHHADPAAVALTGVEPVENVWQHLRANYLSNRVFETYGDIIDAACDAWQRLVALPATITSIGMRDWAHGGQM